MKSFNQLIVGLEEARLFTTFQDAANAAGPGQKPKLDATSNKYILVREETVTDQELKQEELTGKQHKIDKNKNGKIDAQDFKLLRKEQKDKMKTYKEFVTEIKMSDLPSRSVKGSSYGAQYNDPDGADDDEPKKPTKVAADAPKRGRGRPSGSMSGARQQGSAKQTKSGADYTGYKLHLPNSNR